MHQYRYKVIIYYTDFDNTTYSVPYEIFATNEEDAKNIASELFFMDIGTFEDMRFEVSLVEPSEQEKKLVNKKLFEVFGILKNAFEGISYKDFLVNFQNYDGYKLKLSSNFAAFRFRFQDLEFVAVFKDGISYISEKEVVYYAANGRTYIIKNELCDIYVGV